ncbi:MAG: ABC transporter ATP-binding protein [Firmicutes bacterium]|nr:ABC transporter ATP-binding protein [Bacillota bacterium]
MIRFENVTKIFSRGTIPAVSNLNIEIPEGTICCMVGPSGCGKTTSMKMVNRLHSITEGKIYIDEVDNSTIDPISLRLDIGYVIQEIGLFPHMTIADNVATVLVEKKWPKQEIGKRVDELLELMGLEPKIYRQRRPSHLSGGQRQRVGVARAMAANPPIMLMDEPFGAVDHIARVRLQNEFLTLQEKISKTIIFVTHDIDEAIKMGDMIAVMREGKLVQYSTPEDLLSTPADEFVANLVGGNRSIKRLHLIRVSEILNRKVATVNMSDTLEAAKKHVIENAFNVVYVVSDTGVLNGFIGKVELKQEGEFVKDVYRSYPEIISDEATLSDALSVMLSNGESYVPVVDDFEHPLGAVSLEDVFKAVRQDD